MRVLVVDDEENVRKGIATFLELTAMRRWPSPTWPPRGLPSSRMPARLPPRSGTQEAESLAGGARRLSTSERRTGPTSSISPSERRLDLPLIMMSGRGSVRDAVAAVRKGAYDFLEKPLDTDRLLAILRNLERESCGPAKARGLSDRPGSRSTSTLAGLRPWPMPSRPRAGRPPRPSRSSSRADGLGQGARRALGPPLLAPLPGALRRRQLRGRAGRARRERLLRLAQGRLYGSPRRSAAATSRPRPEALSSSTRSGSWPWLSRPPSSAPSRPARSSQSARSARPRSDARIVAATNRDLARRGPRGALPRGPVLAPRPGHGLAAVPVGAPLGHPRPGGVPRLADTRPDGPRGARP